MGWREDWGFMSSHTQHDDSCELISALAKMKVASWISSDEQVRILEGAKRDEMCACWSRSQTRAGKSGRPTIVNDDRRVVWARVLRNRLEDFRLVKQFHDLRRGREENWEGIERVIDARDRFGKLGN